MQLTAVLVEILREYDSATGSFHSETSKPLVEGGHRLKSFLENFIMETFLPQVYPPKNPFSLPHLVPFQVWVDFRGRVTAAMEDPEAFRPQVRTRSKSSKAHEGRILVDRS